MIIERRGLPIDAPITGTELWFIIYSLGLTLDKIASILEHGWTGEQNDFILNFLVNVQCSIYCEHVEWPRFMLLLLLLPLCVLPREWKRSGGPCYSNLWGCFIVSKVRLQPIAYVTYFTVYSRLAFVALSNNVLVL